MLKKIVICLIFTLIVNFASTQLVGDECTRNYDSAPGYCLPSDKCEKVRSDWNLGIKITYCAYLNGEAVVCCPQSSNFKPSNGLRISAQKCMEYEELTYEKFNVWGLLLDDRTQPTIKFPKCNPTTPLIVGGKPTGKGEFPHMVAIGWRRAFGEVSFDCGGSLISERYVLTVAHCNLSGNSPPSFVRLGDHNIKSKNDGLDEVDIDIDEFISHPEYSTKTLKNDIAIIRLVRAVEFSQYIRPACLWQNLSINATKAVATGWGFTGYASPQSDELLKVELDLVSKTKCNSLLEEKLSLSRNKLTDNSQICAGMQTGRDTCSGDSGGPLQATMSGNPCLYHILGLTSFGSVYCGFESPAVYTKVSAFLDFIEHHVWK